MAEGALAERTLIVTPAMRAKVEELVELVVGSLPNYKIADVKFSVTLTLNPAAAGETPSTCRVLLRQPVGCRAGAHLQA